jgi:aryl-phospho-beta-D-glucosidase BglC (GH1 family)
MVHWQRRLVRARTMYVFCQIYNLWQFFMILCTGITPSIFQATNNVNVVDEWTLGQLTDYNTTQKVLETHWETWYTENDFVAMRDAGLNFVRCLRFFPSFVMRSL